MEIKLAINKAVTIDKDPKHEVYFEFPDSKVKKNPYRLALTKACEYVHAFVCNR
jgi:hypothetical protein